MLNYDVHLSLLYYCIIIASLYLSSYPLIFFLFFFFPTHSLTSFPIYCFHFHHLLIIIYPSCPSTNFCASSMCYSKIINSISSSHFMLILYNLNTICRFKIMGNHLAQPDCGTEARNKMAISMQNVRLQFSSASISKPPCSPPLFYTLQLISALNPCLVAQSFSFFSTVLVPEYSSNGNPGNGKKRGVVS